MPGYISPYVSISVFGEKIVDRKIARVGSRSLDFAPVFGAMSAELSKVAWEQFATEGERAGHKWAENEPATDAAKAAKGQPLRIFEATGELKDSFRYGDDLHINEITPDYMRWGSDSEHGEFHQPDKKDRRVFDLTERDKVQLVKMMQYFLVRGEIGLFGLEAG
jgi:hypothetical protein